MNTLKDIKKEIKEKYHGFIGIDIGDNFQGKQGGQIIGWGNSTDEIEKIIDEIN